jgi:hypothetical protein
MDTKDLKGKLGQLESIQSAADSVSKGHFSTHTYVLITALFASGVLAAQFDFWGLTEGTCLVVFLLISKFSTLSRSWATALDDRLTEYEPVDFLAYAMLQALTKDRGSFEINSVLRWIDHEEMVIRAYLPKRTDGQGQRFMSKDLTNFVDPKPGS